MNKPLIFLIACLLTGLTAYSHNMNSDKRKKDKKPPVFNYEEAWKKADTLKEQGLPQSALDVVLDIRTHAKTDRNSPELVKSLLYLEGLYRDTDEEYLKTVYDLYRSDIQSEKEPVKSVLQSLLAAHLNSYFSNYYWRLEKSDNDTGSNPYKWNGARFRHEIISLYDASTQNDAAALRNTSVGQYTVAIHDETSDIISNLYELLLNRALEASISTSEIENNTYTAPDAALTFSHTQAFTAHNFVNENDPHDIYRKYRLFQLALKEQLGRNNTEGIIYYDLKRIEFAAANSKGNDDNTKNLYWDYLLQTYAPHPAVNAVVYAKASYLHYNGKSKEALALADSWLQKHPGAKANGNLRNLRQTILSKALSVTSESLVSPNASYLVQVSYQNLSKVFFYLVPADYLALSKRNTDNEETVKILLKGKTASVLSETLPDFGDYATHTAEIMLPAGANGFYALIAASSENWEQDTNAVVSYTTFWASRLSVQFHTAGNEGAENARILTVLNSQTGQPAAGAEVKITSVSRNYNSKTGAYDTDSKDLPAKTTDASGQLKLQLEKTNYNHYYIISVKSQGEEISESLYDNYYDGYYGNEKDNKRVHIFTDRAIYRPGQTVYYKAISTIEKTNGQRELVSNSPVTLTLFDPDGEALEKREGKTNDFGSYSDSFVLPGPGRLSGYYRIDADFSGSAGFSVEEYKRPKFETVFDSIAQAYKLNDEIRVSGKAMAFAGSAVSGAGLSYTVTRNVRYPYFRDYNYTGRGKIAFPSSPDKVLTSGTAQTDATGAFTVSFKALPDETTDKKQNPYFDYTIKVSVTDLNGETHESSQVITLAYSDRQITLSVPEIQSNGKAPVVSISSTNMQGKNIPHKGILKVEKLAPAAYYKQRLWTSSDTVLATKAEFEAAFPGMDYDPHHSMRKAESVVSEQSLDNSKTSSITLSKLLNAAGEYRISYIAPDGMGGNLTLTKELTLYTPVAGKQVSGRPLDVIDLGNGSYQPGQTCRLLVSTAMPEAYIRYVVSTGNKPGTENNIRLKQGSALISIPVTEAQRGNFDVQFYMVHQYRAYNPRVHVNVPYTNKQLKVSLASFRDKLLPGQKETWTVTISGSKAEKVAAEMMAAMYDASLDQFVTHQWHFDVWPDNYVPFIFNDIPFGTTRAIVFKTPPFTYYPTEDILLPDFLFSEYAYYTYRFSGRGLATANFATADMAFKGGRAAPAKAQADGIAEAVPAPPQDAAAKTSNPPAAPRRNFNETAFFYPQLHTDAKGSIKFTFTMPEALTRWNFMALAHGKALETGSAKTSIITQKDLMVLPDVPRFLRTGDDITIAAKISNVSAKTLSGNTWIEIADAETGENITGILQSAARSNFTVAAQLSTAASWTLKIPGTYKALTIRIMAQSGNTSDGEEHTVPVLSNKVYITESMPFSMRKAGEKSFIFNRLKNNSSPTLVTDKVVVEMSANPAWYAVQALPYVMEYPHECAEQTFNRYYAAALAGHLANSNPAIKKVFDTWEAESKKPGSQTLISKLQKNEDLKALVLEETPWLAEGKNETERMKHLGELFNTAKMKALGENSLARLSQLQLDNGAWSWFSGMNANKYITQYIVAGFGRMKKMGIASNNESAERAISWMDRQAEERYRESQKNPKTEYDADIQYLYARSFFNEVPMEGISNEAWNHWLGKAESGWLKRGKQEQAMTAILLKRLRPSSTVPSDIMKSLKEFSQNSEEMGMYWKDNTGGWYWYEAPVETQALMVEAFDEVARDAESVSALQVWLLRNKQTSNWESTKATADACYALIGNGRKLLTASGEVNISVGGTVLKPENAEAGTGYFRTDIPKENVNSQTADITVKSSAGSLSYGAVHWQYFEDVDKVNSASTNLQIGKKVYRVNSTNAGDMLEEVNGNTVLHVGDKLTVRLTLSSDRPMEYIHLKDMRGSGTEPQNVLSGHKYQNGLSYYESTRDAATNFFIDYLGKGSYVLEYNIFVQQKGLYNNGIATVQCMYAPEFNAHSGSVNLKVE